MACDLCGKVTEDLEAFNDKYAMPKVKMACRSCHKVVGKKIDWLMRSVSRKTKIWMKRKYKL